MIPCSVIDERKIEMKTRAEFEQGYCKVKVFEVEFAKEYLVNCYDADKLIAGASEYFTTYPDAVRAAKQMLPQRG